MYAIMLSGGKQHKVREGSVVKLEKLESGVGDQIIFDQILMVSDEKSVKIGEPLLKDVTVKAEVIEQGRHKKIKILKFRRRKHSMKRQGHRQYFTAVKITQIGAKGEIKAKPEAKGGTKSTPAAKTQVKAKAETKAKPAAKTKPTEKTETKAKPAK